MDMGKPLRRIISEPEKRTAPVPEPRREKVTPVPTKKEKVKT